MTGVKGTDSSRGVGGAGRIQEVTPQGDDEVSLRDPLKAPPTIKVELPDQPNIQAKGGGNVVTVRSDSGEGSGVGKRSRYVGAAGVMTVGAKERPAYERLVELLQGIPKS